MTLPLPRPHSLVIVVLSLCIGSLSCFGDVLSWRNGGSGIYENATAPLTWNEEGAVAWATQVDAGNSCPILIGDKLIFSEEPSNLVCVDAKTGKLLWRGENSLLNLKGLTDEEIAAAEATLAESRRIDKEMARLAYLRDRLGRSSSLPSEEKRKKRDELLDQHFALVKKKKELAKNDAYGDVVNAPTHPTTGYTTGTPVSDGKTVYAYFCLGTAVAYDLDGNRLWHTIARGSSGFGESVSPILVEDKLILKAGDYRALDAATGEELWRTSVKNHHGTPVAFEVEGESFLCTSTGCVIRVSDGKRMGPDLVKHIKGVPAYFGSPILDGDSIYTVKGSNGAEGFAYRFRIPERLADFEKNGLEIVWERDVTATRYYASPLVFDGVFYSFSQKHLFHAMDAETGETLYEELVEGLKDDSYPSMALAGDRIFLGSETGRVAFVEPGREFRFVASTSTKPFRSTPIFVGDRVYLRTNEDIRSIR